MKAPVHDLHVSNLLTYGALAAAVMAVALALDGRSDHLAAAALGLAAIADTFDGRFARLFRRTPRQARCGREIDSLVDAVAFGAAPVVVLLAATGPVSGWVALLGWAAAMFYMLAAVTRLAYYNVDDDHTQFVGVPAPAAALLCATSLLVPTPIWAASWPFVVAGAAMIAPIRIPRPRGLALAVFAGWAASVVGLHVLRS